MYKPQYRKKTNNKYLLLLFHLYSKPSTSYSRVSSRTILHRPHIYPHKFYLLLPNIFGLNGSVLSVFIVHTIHTCNILKSLTFQLSQISLANSIEFQPSMFHIFTYNYIEKCGKVWPIDWYGGEV